jgi:hypothetical protein
MSTISTTSVSAHSPSPYGVVCLPGGVSAPLCLVAAGLWCPASEALPLGSSLRGVHRRLCRALGSASLPGWVYIIRYGRAWAWVRSWRSPVAWAMLPGVVVLYSGRRAVGSYWPSGSDGIPY